VPCRSLSGVSDQLTPVWARMPDGMGYGREAPAAPTQIRFLAYFFFLRLACAKSDPATDLTALLLLVRSSFEALEASFLLVAMVFPFQSDNTMN